MLSFCVLLASLTSSPDLGAIERELETIRYELSRIQQSFPAEDLDLDCSEKTGLERGACCWLKCVDDEGYIDSQCYVLCMED